MTELVSVLWPRICEHGKPNTFLTRYIQLSHPPSIQYFGLPNSVTRISDQNGVSLLYIMLEMHHSGWEPSDLVAKFIETSTTKSVFLWYRPQRDVHFFYKFRMTFT